MPWSVLTVSPKSLTLCPEKINYHPLTPIYLSHSGSPDHTHHNVKHIINILTLGNDVFGLKYLEHLKGAGIDVKHVKLSEERHSGIAQITVTENGWPAGRAHSDGFRQR
ncbi:unnamed protein product [Nesidiocoris tenuis]|uniref:Uncharacterized protein n=1 Tax=Nesidiocoris tenuis TaxID=355587 RepID=A0A6H5GYD8_9HEMI|nr:unnamed protein product [Nesidiocoris tenuis]